MSLRRESKTFLPRAEMNSVVWQFLPRLSSSTCSTHSTTNSRATSITMSLSALRLRTLSQSPIWSRISYVINPLTAGILSSMLAKKTWLHSSVARNLKRHMSRHRFSRIWRMKPWKAWFRKSRLPAGMFPMRWSKLSILPLNFLIVAQKINLALL